MKLDEMYEDTNIINHVLDLKEKGNHKLDDKACGDGSESCGHKFKATNGWNKAVAAATSKKGVDETGLMAVTCFHGIGVRYVNLYGANERHSHGERLLEAMHTDCPEATTMRVCYDVACEFESAVKTMDNDWSKQISVRIGRCHLYGHQLRCHILYNLLRTEGFGVMVGEEVEQLWSMLRHLIASGRYLSGPRRTQKIDSCGLFLAQRQRECLGENLYKRWEKIMAMEEESTNVPLFLALEHALFLFCARLNEAELAPSMTSPDNLVSDSALSVDAC
jgi:hypothetical protein